MIGLSTSGATLVATPSEEAPERDDPVSVRLGRRCFSSRPKVIDDFSGSSVMAALRQVARLRNLDGPDDIAGAIPAAFAEADQPFIEIGVLAALFPLVAVAAHGAVSAAKAGYAQDYPDSVRRVLDQQRRLIDALKHADPQGSDRHDQVLLGRLERLQAEGVRRFEHRQRHRAQGGFSLLRHNLASKVKGVPGNVALSRDFNREAAELIASRFARNRALVPDEAVYQSHLNRKLDEECRLTKRMRTASLFTGVGMPGMAAGMASSAAASSAKAAGNALGTAAAQVAEHTLEATAGGLLMGAQLAQGLAGVANGRIHRAQHRQLRADREAVRGLAADLSPAVFDLYENDTAFRLADSARDQVFDAMLSAGQGLMLGASASHFACPPAAAALAAPGALLTIGASVGASLNERHRGRYLGAGAAESAKQPLRHGNLGPRLRERPIDAVLHEVADDFAEQQEHVVRTRLWRDVLAVLQGEDPRDERAAPTARERHRRLVDRTEAAKPQGAAPLLPTGVERLRTLREERYPLKWFDASPVVLQERLGEELMAHPASASITRLASFRREVLYATARDLAKRDDPEIRALFKDARGRPRRTLAADRRFDECLERHPEARAIHLRHRNEALARALTPVDRFGRADARDAVTDLAHVKRWASDQ